ncbi:MAG: hypothetical protein KBA61_08420 [Spirochaetes bacterium]|nr:hypothetical protein [Spirochaetota bacterium]
MWKTPASALHVLPVYIEERHSGSFYFLADNLDWDTSYHLLLFDHHSDAGEVFNSDYVRRELAASGPGGREVLFSLLKKRGAVQDSNWYEPLMPKPVTAVTWVPGPVLSRAQARRAMAHVREKINGHEEAAPRESGDLSKLVVVRDFAGQKAVTAFDLPVAASLDLDYFNGVPDGDLESAVDRVFDYLLSIDRLAVLTIAVSTMYHPSPGRATRVFELALRRCLYIVNARLRMEPFADNGPDLSPEAAALYKKKSRPPSLLQEGMTVGVRDLIAECAGLMQVENESGKWQRLVESWKKESASRPRLRVLGSIVKIESDGFSIIGKRNDITLSLEHADGTEGWETVRWRALVPAGARFNLVGDGASFARGAPRHVFYREKELPNLKGRTSLTLDDIRPVFAGLTGMGTIRLCAETGEGPLARRTPLARITSMEGETFVGRLTGAFGLPYAFGAGMLCRGGVPVPDALYAADCVSFMIRALRCGGGRVPYTNPGGFRKYLKRLVEVKHFPGGVAHNDNGPLRIDSGMLQRGLVLHFGVHVAALYRDMEPRGLLSENDLVVHHLEGFPEIVPLKNLSYARRPFEVLLVK